MYETNTMNLIVVVTLTKFNSTINKLIISKSMYVFNNMHYPQSPHKKNTNLNVEENFTYTLSPVPTVVT